MASKKAWLSERFKEGLVFKKADVRGKAFIEYIPAENAWSPIEAEGYMFIDCLWVAGQYKGKGISNELLQECIADAKAQKKKGLAILSAKKKLPYLADPKYLKYKGFQIADEIDEYKNGKSYGGSKSIAFLVMVVLRPSLFRYIGF